jgi:pyrroloquinoline quinone biosynthesis protein D
MSEAIPDSRVPRLAIGCRVRTLSADEAMLLVPEGALRLKGAASEIISLIDGHRSVDAVATLLQEKHPVSEAPRIAIEVKQFIEKLHARSVLLYKE